MLLEKINNLSINEQRKFLDILIEVSTDINLINEAKNLLELIPSKTPSKRDIIADIIHTCLYTRLPYQNVGNAYILAANSMLNLAYIKNIDAICALAKFIANNSNDDLGDISEKELDLILAFYYDLIKQYRVGNTTLIITGL